MTDVAIAPAASIDRQQPAPDLFPELLRRVKAAGLFRPRRLYYARVIIANLVVLAGTWTLFVYVGNSWWQLGVAGALGVSSTWIGFMGHDLGHGQITRNTRWLQLLGQVHANLLLGFSFNWWVGHHNKHHSHPNHLTLDSDITRRRVIFIPEQGFDRKGSVKQWIVRNQHKVFFPLLSTEAIGMRLVSVKAVRQRLVRRPRLEGSLMLLHLALYIAALALVLPVSKAIPFVLIQQLVLGLYIGSVFAPNHKGMPIQQPNEDWNWITRQIRTSRNVRLPKALDFLFGGVHLQIEHHLFPAMPRPGLRPARDITRAYCKEVGIDYHEVGVGESYLEILRHLHRTTKTYQARAKALTS